MKKIVSYLRVALVWAGRGLLLLLAMMLIYGAIDQYVSVQLEAEQYPAPGKMVNVNGVNMHILCEGEGSPTVLLEAGLGDFSVSFMPLMEKISAFTRVCVYDRPGMGWSDRIPGIYSAKETAELFHSVLVAAGEKPPYVVAGHSLGGIYNKAFADLYRDEVVGMVLIDSSGEDQTLRIPSEVLALDKPITYLLWACKLSTPFGLFRTMGMIEQFTASEPLSVEQIAMLNARMYTYHFCPAMLDAYASMDMITSQKVTHDYGDMPLIVLERGIGSDDLAIEQPDKLPAGITMEMIVKAEDAWREIQQEHVNMSTRGELIIAEKSQHYIYQTEPELVVKNIREIVEMAR